MDDHKRRNVSAQVGPGMSAPVTEADLHAYADHQLPPERATLVEHFLACRPEEQARVHDWQQQNRLLHSLLDPVMDEPLPLSLPLAPPEKFWSWRALAAGIVVALVSGVFAWSLRGYLEAQPARWALTDEVRPATSGVAGNAALSGFAQRAAVAHVVYSPDIRRPVEVSADQEQALVTWLTKRIGAAVRPPMLNNLGYELIGGRLLPGERGPVAQFMYDTAEGQRLTLYVTREVPDDGNTSFRFGKVGAVNVFYWIENHFGYAISAGSDKNELMRVSQEVYAQLQRP